MAEGYELYAKIINASLLTIITYCSIAFIFKLALPRTALIIAPIIAFFLEVIARWQMRQWLHRSRKKGSCKYKTVVIGSSDGINRALRTMQDYSNWGYSPVAVCPIEADGSKKDAYVVTSFEPDPTIEGADMLKVIPRFPARAKAFALKKCMLPTCCLVIPKCCMVSLLQWNLWAWSLPWLCLWLT